MLHPSKAECSVELRVLDCNDPLFQPLQPLHLRSTHREQIPKDERRLGITEALLGAAARVPRRTVVSSNNRASVTQMDNGRSETRKRCGRGEDASASAIYDSILIVHSRRQRAILRRLPSEIYGAISSFDSPGFPREALRSCFLDTGAAQRIVRGRAGKAGSRGAEAARCRWGQPDPNPSGRHHRSGRCLPVFAKQIPAVDAREGVVVGVLGAWGSGKTLFGNLAREEVGASRRAGTRLQPLDV